MGRFRRETPQCWCRLWGAVPVGAGVVGAGVVGAGVVGLVAGPVGPLSPPDVDIDEANCEHPVVLTDKADRRQVSAGWMGGLLAAGLFLIGVLTSAGVAHAGAHARVGPADSAASDSAASDSAAPGSAVPVATGSAVPGATAVSTATAFADLVLKTWPDPTKMTSSGFQYDNGMVLQGVSEVYRLTGDHRYLAWITAFYDKYVDITGKVKFNDSVHNIDYIQPGSPLVFLYQQTHDSRYATALRQVYDRLLTQPRNPDGGFWHKDTYPNEMWADGLYMGDRFAAVYGQALGVPAAVDTATTQTMLFTRHAFLPDQHLVRHAWDSDHNASWADRTTGLSPVIWGRSVGWYAMALVDQLAVMPATDPRRAELGAVFTDLADGLARTQDGSGLWYQVMDQPSASGNFLESSATGFFVYSLLEGVRLGLLDPRYRAVANLGWRGLQSKFARTAGGAISITDAVEGMGVTGSVSGYVNHKRLTNSPHGLMAAMLAAVAVARADAAVLG